MGSEVWEVIPSKDSYSGDFTCHKENYSEYTFKVIFVKRYQNWDSCQQWETLIEESLKESLIDNSKFLLKGWGSFCLSSDFSF